MGDARLTALAIPSWRWQRGRLSDVADYGIGDEKVRGRNGRKGNKGVGALARKIKVSTFTEPPSNQTEISNVLLHG